MKRRKNTYVPEIVIVCIIFLMLLLGSAMRRPDLENNVETIIYEAEKSYRVLSFNENTEGK